MSTMAVRNGELPQRIEIMEVSKLQEDATLRAVKKLRLPDSKITHLVFYIPSRDSHSPDYHLSRLLDVPPSVRHFQYETGHYDKDTIISVFRNFSSKFLSYVLLVCSEFTLVRKGGSSYRGQEASRDDHEVEDLRIRLEVTEKELARVRKENYEAQVSAVKANRRAEEAEARLGAERISYAIATGQRSSRT